MDRPPAPPFVPKLAIEWRDRMAKDLVGCSVQVVQLNDHAWQLVAESDRVRLTMDFDLGGNHKGRRRGSTLAVDGVEREHARDYNHLKAIFRDPDKTERAVPRDVPPFRSLDDAPTAVQSACKFMSKAGLPVQAGEADGEWVVGFDVNDRSLRMGFRRSRKQWVMHFMQVILEGEDRSREVGTLAEALELLSGVSLAGPGDKKPSIAGTSRAARSNPVETRKATVFRV